MQGQGGIKFFIFQNPGPDHFPAAAAALFCRLEDKAHASVPVFPQLPQNPGRSCQIGRMHIVAAGVHDPRVPGTKGQVIFLPHGQRVHIRPQEQVFPRCLSFQVRDQPGAGNAGTQGKAHRAEGLPDFFRRFEFPKSQFRLPVYLPAQFQHIFFIPIGKALDLFG